MEKDDYDPARAKLTLISCFHFCTEDLGEKPLCLTKRVWFAHERALALKVSLPEESADMIKPSHLLEMIPSVVHAITRRGVGGSLSELAINLKVPEKLVQVMSEAIIVPFGQLVEAGQITLPYNIGEVPPTANVGYPTEFEGNSHWVV